MRDASTDHRGDDAPRRASDDAVLSNAIRVAKAIGALWECSALYEPGHPSFESALKECSEATGRIAQPLIFRVHESGLAVDDDDGQRYAKSFASRLRSRSIVGISFHRSLSADVLIELMGVLGCKDLTPPEAIEKIFASTGGAVRAFQPSEQTSAASRGDEDTGLSGEDREISFGSSRASLPSSLPAEVEEIVGRLQSCDGEASLQDGERGPADAMQWFQQQFAQLEGAHQRQLLEALSSRESLSFEHAAFALSQMPLTNLTDAMAVLARKDSQVSETSLLLLRRMADLAVGSATDLRSLASIAAEWADKGTARTPEQEKIARVSAEILGRQSEGEFRSESYSTLLNRMIEDTPAPKTSVAMRLEDEQSSLPAVATEIICDLAESPPDNDIDVSNLYEVLTQRAARLASDGRFDTLQRIIKLATATSRKAATQEQRKAAHALLEIANKEHWLADALARCPSAIILTEQLDLHRERGGDAIDLLLEVARRTQSSGARAAVIEASRRVPSSDLVDRCILAADADPTDAVRLAFLVAEHDAEQLPTLLRSALLGSDANSREHAFRLMERLGGAWPRALIIRALSDDDAEIRLIGAQAAMPHHAALLVERLRGDVGVFAPNLEESRQLARILDQDRSDDLTNDIARSALRRFAFSLRSDHLSCLVYVLSRRPETRLSRLTLQAARLRVGSRAPDRSPTAQPMRSAA